MHTSLAVRTHLAPAPHGLVTRWKKLSKLREGWDFGTANVFKRQFCL